MAVLTTDRVFRKMRTKIMKSVRGMTSFSLSRVFRRYSYSPLQTRR
jgi:hypothetical protein